MTLIIPFRENSETIKFLARTDARWAEGRITPLVTLTHKEIKGLGGERALVSAFGEAVEAIRGGKPHSPTNAAGRFAHDRTVEAFCPRAHA